MSTTTKHETMELVNAPAQQMQPIAIQPMTLVERAMSAGASMEQLLEVMALQERQEANEARKQYNAAFSAFKAEAVIVVKNRSVSAGPLNGKKYAELYAVVNAATPALSRHGLSASWRLTKDERDWIEVSCTLRHIGGHSETVSMGGPPDSGGAKNAIQARASTVTYLERYTLKAILGLSEQEDDDDGNGKEQDISTLLSGLLDTTSNQAALDYWNEHKEEVEANNASYNRFKAAVVSHRKTFGATA